MNYYGTKELAASFRTVRKNTIQIAKDIPAADYGFSPAEGSRSIAHTLVHIAVSPRFHLAAHGGERRTNFDGFDFPSLVAALTEEEAKDRTKAEVIDLLGTEGETFARFLEGLSEDFLGERFDMPPGAIPASKSRFEMLLSAKEHEMHHRGQLMVSQRLLGIVPHLTKMREEQQAQAQAEAAASSGS